VIPEEAKKAEDSSKLLQFDEKISGYHAARYQVIFERKL